MFPFMLVPGLVIVAISLVGTVLLRWRMRSLYKRKPPAFDERAGEMGIEVEFHVEDADGRQ